MSFFELERIPWLEIFFSYQDETDDEVVGETRRGKLVLQPTMMELQMELAILRNKRNEYLSKSIRPHFDSPCSSFAALV